MKNPLQPVTFANRSTFQPLDLAPKWSIITVAETVDEAAFARIHSLARRLREVDSNLQGVPLDVRRGSTTAVSLNISGEEDKMREQLLTLLLADALESEPDSRMGSLV